MQALGPRRRTRLGRRQLQVALGVVWLLDAVLECQPEMFRPEFFGNMLMMNPSEPPAWLWTMIVRIEPVVTAHAAMTNWLAVAIQFGLGLGLLYRPCVRPALALSIPWALAVWLFGEMGGGLFVEGGSALTGAPGPALIYAVLAVLLWPRRADDGEAAADAGILPRPGPRLLWAALWLGTAALEAGYLNRSPTFAAQAMDTAAQAGPGWLRAAGSAVGGLVGDHGAAFAICSAVAQTVIGMGIFWRPARRAALVAGMALALFYAVVGQALGGIFANGFLGVLHSGATDPGTGPLVILFAATLWPRDVGGQTSVLPMNSRNLAADAPDHDGSRHAPTTSSVGRTA